VPKDLSTYFAEEEFQDKDKKYWFLQSELTRKNGKSKKCTLSHLLH
jgi:hypothetical protein